MVTTPTTAGGSTGAVNCFGIHIPPEILNNIFDMVLEADNTALILPRPFPIANLYEIQNGIAVGRQGSFISSPCTLHGLNRESRALYNSRFQDKFHRSGVENLVVIIQDFDFDCFDERIIVPLIFNNDALVALMQRQFTVRLDFTEDFLNSPSDKGIKKWLDTHLLEAGQNRAWNYNYDMKPIPEIYTEPFRHFVNQITFERRRAPGPELAKLLSDIGQEYNSGRVVKEGIEWEDEAEEGYDEQGEVLVTGNRGVYEEEPDEGRVVTGYAGSM